MISEPGLITRIALFSSLAYILSYLFSFIPNVNPIFFVIFAGGWLWGLSAGSLIGIIGMGLWTLLNPYGPAGLPVMSAQIFGAMSIGYLGGLSKKIITPNLTIKKNMIYMGIFSILATLIFYIPVTIIDAWVYQPFMPRFISGITLSLFSLVSNLLIFPLLFPAVKRLYERENRLQWKKS